MNYTRIKQILLASFIAIIGGLVIHVAVLLITSFPKLAFFWFAVMALLYAKLMDAFVYVNGWKS